MISPRNCLVFALIVCACAARAGAQAPNVIQFFMPDNSYPSGELRFRLTRDDGRIETLFTDSKGKYSMTRDMVKETGYTITVEGDRRSFETTTHYFRLQRVSEIIYVTVFLRPLRAPKVPRASVLDLSAEESGVPAEARDAYARGRAAVEKGAAEEAIAGLKRAVELHPNYLRALNDLGVLYLKLGRLDEAGDAFARALKVNDRFELARLNLGTVLNRQGKHAEAAPLLEALYKANPMLPGARDAYVDALFYGDRLAEARKVLRAELEDEAAPKAARTELHYKLARVLIREEKFSEAVKELKRAVDLDPQAFNARLLLGGSLLHLKREPEAEAQLLRAYETGGAAAGHAQLMLGEMYTRQRRYDAALKAFEQYLRDVPDAPNAAQVRGVVVKLRTPAEKK